MKLYMSEGEMMTVKRIARIAFQRGGDPCRRCSPAERAACCGCAGKRQYDDLVKPIKNLSLTEPFRDYMRYLQVEEDYKAACREMDATRRRITEKYENSEVFLAPPEPKPVRSTG